MTALAEDFEAWERHARLAIEAMFAEVEARQSRGAYVEMSRDGEWFRSTHVAFDAAGVHQPASGVAVEPSAATAVSSLVRAVRDWLAEQPTKPERRKLVWRYYPEIEERRRRSALSYAAYCRLGLVEVGDALTFSEDVK